MARKLFRSAGDSQIVPDVLLRRRFEAPYSVDQPVGESSETLPLLSNRRGAGLFDHVGQMAYAGLQGREDVPMLGWERPIYGVTKRGAVRPNGKTTTTLLSSTSKMSCQSFSVPAGPPKEGGSCVSAALPVKPGGLREPEKSFTCAACYATENRYTMPDTALSQAARMMWVIRTLEADPSGAELARQLVMGITDFARRSTLGGARVETAEDRRRKKAGGKKHNTGPMVRLQSEIGVWQRGRIEVPIGRHPEHFEKLQYWPATVTPLPAWTSYGSSRAFFQALGPTEGAVTGFFRIHDAGDLSVGNSSAVWRSYLQAWVLIAQALPFVWFWMPTRVWVLQNLVEELRAASGETPNLVIRPSALHTDDLAPDFSGMAMGTTVVRFDPKGKELYPKLPNVRTGCDTLVCPVWPRNIARPDGTKTPRSCQAAGCRACWIGTDVAVGYGFH